MFKLNLKIAFRNLWKHKSFTLINTGGLAIGLASCMCLLLYVAYEWGYDRQFTSFDRTYVVYNNVKTNSDVFSNAWTPGVMAREIREKIPGVAFASRATYPANNLISYKQNNFKKEAIFADSSFLKILDYKMLQGNSGSILQNPNSIVLTKSFAKALFGNEDPMNKMVKINGTEPLRVEGIIADIPKNSTLQFSYLVPWAMAAKLAPWIRNSTWNSNFCLTLVQLKDNRYLDETQASLKDIYIRNNHGTLKTEAFLHPLAKWHLYSEFENGKSVGGKIDQLKMFLFFALCILMIACVNFMNLSTARSQRRAKEVGIKKTIGSSRYALISQFIIESILLSVLGAVVAFVLLEVSLPYFNNVLGTAILIEYVNWRFWFVFTLLILFTGLIAGSYPAFFLSSLEPVKVLKGTSMAGNSSFSIRKILVVFQFVFSACLIICTTVIYQQIGYIKNKPIGYNQNNLVQFPLQGTLENKQKQDLLKEQLLKSGAITDITVFSRGLSEIGHKTFQVDWPGKAANEQVMFNYRYTDNNFIKTIGTKLVAGKEFSFNYTADSSTIIVNEAAVKIMGLKNPVGTLISEGGARLKIIGVIKDFVMESAYQKAAPMLIFPNIDNNAAVILARLNNGQNISTSVARVNEVVKNLNPAYPVELSFVNDDFAAKLDNEKLLGTLSNWFGGFALFISCLGLLGLVLFMAEQRKKEISIRKVLGAGTVDILTLLNKEFIKLVVIADLIAFPVGYIMAQRWLSAYEFRTSITFLPFGIAIGMSLIIALLTVSLQSVSVSKTNPIDALKCD